MASSAASGAGSHRQRAKPTLLRKVALEISRQRRFPRQDRRDDRPRRPHRPGGAIGDGKIFVLPDRRSRSPLRHRPRPGSGLVGPVRIRIADCQPSSCRMPRAMSAHSLRLPNLPHRFIHRPPPRSPKDSGCAPRSASAPAASARDTRPAISGGKPARLAAKNQNVPFFDRRRPCRAAWPSW